MALTTLHEDRLYFAIGQIGPAHDVQCSVRVCVDQCIDSLQFTNLGNQNDIRVTAYTIVFVPWVNPTLTGGYVPALSAMYSRIDPQIPLVAFTANLIKSSSWDSVVHWHD